MPHDEFDRQEESETLHRVFEKWKSEQIERAKEIRAKREMMMGDGPSMATIK